MIIKEEAKLFIQEKYQCRYSLEASVRYWKILISVNFLLGMIRLFDKIALIKVDKLFDHNSNISSKTQEYIRILAPLLMLPSDVRSEYSKTLFQQKLGKHEKTKDALRFLKNRLINID